MPLAGIITQDAEGAVQWKIKGFTSLELDAVYISPNFSCAGRQWLLYIRRVRPEGGWSGQCIELQLIRWSDGPRTLNVWYTFSVRDRDGHKHGERRNRKEFGRNDASLWIGFELKEERMFDLVQGDTLTVLCRLEPVDPTLEAAELKEELWQKTGELASVRRELAENQSELVRLRHLNEELNLKVTDLEAERDNVQKLLQTKTEASASGSTLHKTRLHQDLKRMFLNQQEDCDVIIRVKEREFKAHGNILKARSPVFASTLCADMKEKATGIINIDDLDPSAFSDFLHFLYCEEVDSLSAENVFNLYAAADKYDVPNLRSMCIEFMRENLCVDTFCDIMRLALLHSETELISLCTNFFIRNATKVIKTVQWQRFIVENPTESNELFLKFATSVERFIE